MGAVLRAAMAPHEHEQFTFLGYTFRPRVALGRGGETFVSFSPAISSEAAKKIRATIRAWRLHLRGSETLEGLAQAINPIVRGWTTITAASTGQS